MSPATQALLCDEGEKKFTAASHERNAHRSNGKRIKYDEKPACNSHSMREGAIIREFAKNIRHIATDSKRRREES